MPSLPMMAAILLVAAFTHWTLFPFFTSDMRLDYVPWFDHIVSTGSLAAFSAPFGSYTPPYLYGLAALSPLKGIIPDPYIVKLWSLLGNASVAAALWHLLTRLNVPAAGRIALCALTLPSVVLNAALLGQCDAMYTAPCVMAAAAAIDRKHRWMLVWCGLALAIKAQAVLLAPFVLALLLGRRVPVRDWFVAPAAFIAVMLPALVAGWPAADILSIYFRQANTFHDLARNAPNIWMILELWGFGLGSMSGIATACAIAAVIAYVTRLTGIAGQLSNPMLLRAALLAPLLTAGLLPKMHERYFFIADILALALAATVRDRDSVRIAVLVQFGSTAGLLAYLTGAPGLAALGAATMILATVMVARPLLGWGKVPSPTLAAAG